MLEVAQSLAKVKLGWEKPVENNGKMWKTREIYGKYRKFIGK